MGLIFGEDLAQVAGVHDEDPVEEFTAYAAHQRSMIAFIRGACGAASMIWIPAARNTSSNIAVNFAVTDHERDVGDAVAQAGSAR
jgi:hypothetical protein